MKKILSVLLVCFILVVPFSVIVSADNFVPSIGYKPAPVIKYEEDDEGRKVIGHVVDPNGNILSTEYHDCLVITPVSEAETSEKIPADAAELLLQVYDELSDEDMKLSSLSDELNDMVAKDLGKGKDADDLVIKDLFDVTVLCDELKEKLAPIGNTLTLTFEVSIGANVPVYVMTYKNDKWAPVVEAINNGDGTITCTFEDFCPVAFFVPTSGGENVKPEPGDTTDNTLWMIVMVSAIALIAVLLVINRKNLKRSEH